MCTLLKSSRPAESMNSLVTLIRSVISCREIYLVQKVFILGVVIIPLLGRDPNDGQHRISGR